MLRSPSALICAACAHKDWAEVARHRSALLHALWESSARERRSGQGAGEQSWALHVYANTATHCVHRAKCLHSTAEADQVSICVSHWGAHSCVCQGYTSLLHPFFFILFTMSSSVGQITHTKLEIHIQAFCWIGKNLSALQIKNLNLIITVAFIVSYPDIYKECI